MEMSRSAEEQEYITGMRDSGLSEEDFSDDELGSMFREMVGVEDDEDTTPDGSGVAGGSDSDDGVSAGDESTGEEEPEPLRVEGFKVYVEDKEVEDLRAVAIDDLITKATLGYTALGKEQRKTLAEVVRNAQLGHLNSQRQESLEADLQRMREIVETSDSELSNLRKQAAQWDKVLQQAALGNVEPMQQLIERFASRLGGEEESGSGLTAEAQELQDIKLQQAGQQILEQQIRPYLQEMGKEYGYVGDAYQQLENYALGRIGQIPRQLQTVQRIERLLTVELPAELEANRYSNTAVVEQQQDSAETEQLRNQLAALSKELKELKEAQELESAPPGSGAGSSFGSADAEKRFESDDGDFDVGKFRDFLQDR